MVYNDGKYCELCLSKFSTIFQKSAGGINGARRLKNGNFTVTPAMHFHFRGRRNYTMKLGVPSTNAEGFNRKKRTLSGRFNYRKDCFTVVVLLLRKKGN